MISPRYFQRLSRTIHRKYATKPKVVLSEEVQNSIEKEIYKPRLHPGIIRPKTVKLPEKIVQAIQASTEDFPIKSLLNDSVPMVRHLHSRVPPMEREQLIETKEKLLNKILQSEKRVQMSSGKEDALLTQKVKDKLDYALKQKVYNWKPMEYNTHNSLVYLIGRGAQEYAVLVKIFSEIQQRDESFKPKSMFDFGSGVGTATWAASLYWKKSIFEYFNVDTSADMNDLAQIILQGGRGNKASLIKGTFYRQFFPHRNITYDLVVSAYTLLELPSFEMRMETILRLWNKTEKYLVLVEHGTNAGFKVINEARDFLLQVEDSEGHIFSPCSHDVACPRFMKNDGTPCNFQVGYHPLPFGGQTGVQRELYSYVILKKGKREVDDPQWPRVVRPVLVKSKHSICRMCTANGKLEEVIFTAAKHGKTAYHCARSSKWGDLIPVKLNSEDN